MTIKVTKISGPTKREIKVECPDCGHPLYLDIPIEAREGNDRCAFCGTEFKWEETNDTRRNS